MRRFFYTLLALIAFAVLTVFAVNLSIDLTNGIAVALGV